MDLECFARIEVGDPSARGGSVKTAVRTTGVDGRVREFELRWRYDVPVRDEDAPLLRLAALMPMANYGPFTGEIVADFPLARADASLMQDVIDDFGLDVFVNKVLRRRADYILPQYLQGVEDAGPESVPSMARLVHSGAEADRPIAEGMDGNACGILSSSGKESLLTYGLMREVGADVHPLYVNESGGHWRTALTAYRHHSATDANTARVWTNVDRFYTFMLDGMRIIRPDHRKVWADTYPIRLCIFPVYIFLLMPLFARKRIGNLLMGNEFDDIREMPTFRGIPHSFGIRDQWQTFDLRMEEWYGVRMPGLRQWSALRPVAGLIVERVLIDRYPGIAPLQRSCHSCSIEGGRIVQCGQCSKCLGVLLFIIAAGADPSRFGFREEDVARVPERLLTTSFRIDPDEEAQARLLASRRVPGLGGEPRPHVESIHIHPYWGDLAHVPDRFRDRILDILEEYVDGYTRLEGGEWAKAERPTFERR
ncbi:MAG: hypothetical protein L0Z54_06695 [Thermoplasmata archaeon]|nr:hypothetical protein [Thermoplasmata archaeon]